MRIQIKAAVLPVALAAITACGETDSDPGDGVEAQLPNPAATFCDEQGGEYILETSECRLADGTVVDAWEYFRQHKQGKTEE